MRWFGTLRADLGSISQVMAGGSGRLQLIVAGSATTCIDYEGKQAISKMFAGRESHTLSQIEGCGLQSGRTAQDDSREDGLLQLQDEAGAGGFTSYLSQNFFKLQHVATMNRVCKACPCV